MVKETWNVKTGEFIPVPENVINFYNDIVEVYKKYNLSISHEDYHGSFIVEDYNPYDVEWLKNAGLRLE